MDKIDTFVAVPFEDSTATLILRKFYLPLYYLPQHPEEPQQQDFFLCGWAIEILVFLPEPDAASMAFSARTVSEVYWISPTRSSISLL